MEMVHDKNEIMVLNKLNLDDDLTIKTYKRYHPYLYHLKDVEMFIFGTLTWRQWSHRRSSYDSHVLRKKDFNNLIRSFRKAFGITRKKLSYYAATEYGAGEAHFHFLIARNGLEHLSATTCSKWLENKWRNGPTSSVGGRTRIGGQAHIEPYDAAFESAGVAYCLKREWNGNGDERERYDELSEPLIKLLKWKSFDASSPVMPQLITTSADLPKKTKPVAVLNPFSPVRDEGHKNIHNDGYSKSQPDDDFNGNINAFEMS